MKKILYPIIFLTLLIVNSGCNLNQNEKETNKQVKKRSAEETHPERDESPYRNSLPYLALQNIDRYRDSIKKNPKAFFNGNDNCVLNLIDTVADLYIASQKVQYLDILASMAEKSDGYVSEGLGSVFYYKIFIHSPQNY